MRFRRNASREMDYPAPARLRLVAEAGGEVQPREAEAVVHHPGALPRTALGGGLDRAKRGFDFTEEGKQAR